MTGRTQFTDVKGRESDEREETERREGKRMEFQWKSVFLFCLFVTNQFTSPALWLQLCPCTTNILYAMWYFQILAIFTLVWFGLKHLHGLSTLNT